jgi:N-acetylneuraminic acid mutarotase
MTTGALNTGRAYHTATLLPNGKVLVAGGENPSSPGIYLSSAELYDPTAGTWTTTGSLATSRAHHTATLLPNGKVLVAGGYNFSYPASAELYDPATGKWTTSGALKTARDLHTATLLPNGQVLVAGGI